MAGLGIVLGKENEKVVISGREFTIHPMMLGDLAELETRHPESFKAFFGGSGVEAGPNFPFMLSVLWVAVRRTGIGMKDTQEGKWAITREALAYIIPANDISSLGDLFVRVLKVSGIGADEGEPESKNDDQAVR